MDDEQQRQPRTLKTVFAEAETKREALEGTYEASSPGYREALAEAIGDYEECLHLISSLGIFSPNESADDIESHDLLDGSYRKLLDAYDAAPATFSTTVGADATARRDAKIANFRAEKDLKARLATLQRQQQAQDGNADADDEVARAAYLAHVRFAAHMAFQALEGLNRAAEVLAQAPEPLLPQTTSVEEDDERRRAAGNGTDGYDAGRLDRPLRRLQSAVGGGGPLLSKEGKPLQPFTIVGNRAEMAKAVFRPGHNLPTMSIDEYLEEERRRGGNIE